MTNLSAKLSMIGPVIIAPTQGRQPIIKAADIVPVQTVEPVRLSSSDAITISTSRYSPAFGGVKELKQVDYSNPAFADAGSHELLKSVSRGSVAGGALRMSELLARGDTEYRQDMRQYSTFSFPVKDGSYPPLDLNVFEDLDKDVEQGFSFQLKTKDGDSINFSFERYVGYGVSEGETQVDERGFHITDKRIGGFKGVEISLNVDGKLSKDERQQLELLAEKLEELTMGYFEGEQSALNQFDFSEFDLMEQVDLSFSKYGKEVLSVSYTDTDLYRSIEMNADGAKAKITIDKTSLGMTFNAEQQAKAKQAYMSLLQESATEAKSRSSAAMMQAVFELGFNNLVPDSQDKAGVQNSSVELNEQASSSVIALPDFDFAYQSRMTKPNAINRPDEYQGFNMKMSLNSLISENKNTGRMDIVQTQKFDIKGAYYEPLDHLEVVDFEHQNYQYTEFSRSTEKVSHLMLQNGAIESLLVAQEGEAKSRTQVYEGGKLMDDIKKRDEFASLKSYTDLAQEQNREQNHEILKALVIDPYEKHVAPDKRGIVRLDGAVEWLRSELGHVLNVALEDE
jgi:hypothetical protein